MHLLKVLLTLYGSSDRPVMNSMHLKNDVVEFVIIFSDVFSSVSFFVAVISGLCAEDCSKGHKVRLIQIPILNTIVKTDSEYVLPPDLIFYF